MYEKLRKLNLKRRFSLRTALMASLTLALLVSATVFMTVSASDDVTPTDMADATEAAEAAEATDAAEVTEAADVSPTSFPSGRHTTGHSVSRSEKVSPTDVSASDNVVFAGGAFSKDTGVDPAILGDPVITMTSDRESCGIYDGEIWVLGRNVMIDYGDGVLIEYEGSDHTIKGANIKIYGDNITYLNCTACALTSLNVSRATELTELTCMNNPGITSLDVSKNTALTELECGENQLTALDVSKNTSLTELECGSNQLTELDVTKNTALTRLSCYRNQLTALDVSKNTALTELSCDINQLTALDVSKNTALTELSCSSNQLTTLDVSGCTALAELCCSVNELTALNMSGCIAMRYLECGVNQLTALNVSKNTALTWLSCGVNQLTALDVTKNTVLADLSCWGNQLTTLDVSKNTALTWLGCWGNQLTALDVSQNTALEVLWCDDNELPTLDVSKNTALTELRCHYNQLTMPQIDSFTKTVQSVVYAPQTHVIPSTVKVGDAIDLSSEYSVDGTVTQYTWYDGDGNVIVPATANGGVFTFGEDAAGKTLVCKMTNAKLPEFMSDVNVQVDWNEEVGDIYEIQDHRLTTTEVTIEAAEPVLGDPVITMTTSKAVGESMDGNLTFDIAGNNVFVDYGDNKPVAYPGEKTVKGKTIKIYGDNITELYLCENKLTSLNVSKPADLMTLWCDNNQLTSINLSGCSSLTQLYCTNNQLSSIDVSDCNSLIKLYCSDNQLTTLDASACSALVEIVCTNNQLTSLTVPNPEDELFVSCDNNRLTIPQVYTIDKSANVHLADYAPQMHVIPSAIKVGESIDLSSEYSVDGTASEFVWYDSDENVITPATANGGVFTFGDDAVGKTLVCKMTNAKLPDFCEDSGEYPEWDENGNETGNMIPYEYDNRLFTTEVAIEAKDPEEPVSSDDSVSSQENEDVQGDPVIYYDLAFKQDENVDGVSEVLYPERTMISINGMGVDLHSVKGVHLTVGNIETNTKKTVLDAIKHYNETFDTETTDIALYDISLEDKNNVHVKVVAGEILVCLKYPDNLARQSEDYVFHLYHQKADGTIEEIPVTIRRNGIWFRATDFSPYVLYWHVKTVESAGTGESFALIIVMTVLCALSVAGAGYALYRRKKLTAE